MVWLGLVSRLCRIRRPLEVQNVTRIDRDRSAIGAGDLEHLAVGHGLLERLLELLYSSLDEEFLAVGELDLGHGRS
jgi:hypothetical protein